MDQVTPTETLVDNLGQLLVDKGMLEATAFDRARRVLAVSKERFDIVLTRLGLVSESDMADVLAEHLSLERSGLAEVPLEPVLPDELAPRFLKANRLLPTEFKDGVLTIAMVDPFNTDAVRAISYLTEGEIVRKVITPADYERAVRVLYDAQDTGEVADTDGELLFDEAVDDDVERLRNIASEAPIVRLFNPSDQLGST